MENILRTRHGDVHDSAFFEVVPFPQVFLYADAVFASVSDRLSAGRQVLGEQSEPFAVSKAVGPKFQRESARPEVDDKHDGKLESLGLVHGH